jgi:hypothetical protein
MEFSSADIEMLMSGWNNLYLDGARHSDEGWVVAIDVLHGIVARLMKQGGGTVYDHHVLEVTWPPC